MPPKNECPVVEIERCVRSIATPAEPRVNVAKLSRNVVMFAVGSLRRAMVASVGSLEDSPATTKPLEFSPIHFDQQPTSFLSKTQARISCIKVLT